MPLRFGEKRGRLPGESKDAEDESPSDDRNNLKKGKLELKNASGSVTGLQKNTSELHENAPGSPKEIKINRDAMATKITGQRNGKQQISDTKGKSGKSFFVTFSMIRTGERRISQVLVSPSRPPNNYSTDNKTLSGNQGPHIVAYSLMNEAVRSGLVGTTLIPAKQSSGSLPDTIDTVKRLYHLPYPNNKEYAFDLYGTSISKQIPIGTYIKVTFGTVHEQILSLIERRDDIVNLDELLEKNYNQEARQEQVRSKVSELRQDLNIVTEDIIRLWNKRKGTTYSEKGGTDALQFGRLFYNLCGADIAGRENSAIQRIEMSAISDALGDVAIDNIDNTTTDTATSKLANSRSASNIDVAKSIARLIDIKSVEEIKSFEILEAQYEKEEVLEVLKDKYFDTNKDTDKKTLNITAKLYYKKLLKDAVEEACRLARIVLKEDPSTKKSKVDETLVLRALFTASKEDLEKAIKNGKEGKKSDKELGKLNNRLHVANKLKAIKKLDFRELGSIFDEEEPS